MDLNDVDPRLRPGAYISHGSTLYEVIGWDERTNGTLDENYVRMRNVRNEKKTTYGTVFVLAVFRLRRDPPTVPDYPPQDARQTNPQQEAA